MLSGHATVLLVDDDPDDRFLAEQAWRKAGIENPLRTIADGQEALDYFSGKGAYADRPRQRLPALLLLDIKIPGVCGFDILRYIRGHEGPRLLPVIIFSASTSPSDVAEAYRLGANGFFIKPSSLHELVELMTSLKDCWLRFNEFPV